MTNFLRFTEYATGGQLCQVVQLDNLLALPLIPARHTGQLLRYQVVASE